MYTHLPIWRRGSRFSQSRAASWQHLQRTTRQKPIGIHPALESTPRHGPTSPLSALDGLRTTRMHVGQMGSATVGPSSSLRPVAKELLRWEKGDSLILRGRGAGEGNTAAERGSSAGDRGFPASHPPSFATETPSRRALRMRESPSLSLLPLPLFLSPRGMSLALRGLHSERGDSLITYEERRLAVVECGGGAAPSRDKCSSALFSPGRRWRSWGGLAAWGVREGPIWDPRTLLGPPQGRGSWGPGGLLGSGTEDLPYR
jgi:hypothetical protein